jgi:hypothetical protein
MRPRLPGHEANWGCEPGFDTLPRDPLITVALDCLYPPSP